jgi:hypothetical protein
MLRETNSANGSTESRGNTKLEKLVQVASSEQRYAVNADLHYMAIKIRTINRQILLEVDKKVAVNANRKISQVVVASSVERTTESNTV